LIKHVRDAFKSEREIQGDSQSQEGFGFVVPPLARTRMLIRLSTLALTMDNQLFTAVILVGGPTRGTRFRPLSLDIAKPLFPVGGHPLIYHHIAACANQFGDKMHKIFLLGSFEDDTFTSFISKTKSELGVDIEYVLGPFWPDSGLQWHL
jgi:hypothetical protein